MGVMVDRKADVADALAGARARTTALLAPLDDAALTAQHSTLMSPLVWDLAHIAHYEELWLVRALGVRPPRHQPPPARPPPPLLAPGAARSFGEAVRRRVPDAGIPPTGEPRIDALLASD